MKFIKNSDKTIVYDTSTITMSDNVFIEYVGSTPSKQILLLLFQWQSVVLYLHVVSYNLEHTCIH